MNDVVDASVKQMAKLRAITFINEHFPDLESLKKAPQLCNELESTKANLEKEVLPSHALLF